MIAALFVATGGTYYGLPDVDPWDEARDARRYAGPWAVVAHPPCQRWGKYWYGGQSASVRRVRGDDEGCFASALASVRRFGGVLEHPQGSAAWAAHGLVAPPRAGGWVSAGDMLGWTTCVEQGHYGHRARKPTWLYAVGCDLPDLPRGPAPESWRTDPTRSERWRARAERDGVCVLLSRRERAATPEAFRDVLLAMARSVTMARRPLAAGRMTMNDDTTEPMWGACPDCGADEDERCDDDCPRIAGQVGLTFDGTAEPVRWTEVAP